ncbi:MAG TPA: response regulator, partial [Gammaproteobacteria bacterium]
MQNVLVLEDHPETRSWLCDILNQAFKEVAIAEASSQAQARKLITEKKFDLALIDLNLPDGNGV